MPRAEERPITWSKHARQRASERGASEAEAEAIVRAGAWHADGTGTNGEPKWAAEGAFSGKQLRVVFIETTERAIHVLHVVTVIVNPALRR